ncbi:MAG: TonB-dependent receptor domain-containing protein, partial [Bryobacteraceae bacterium]
IQNWKNVAAQSFYHGAYVQDEWRVTSKLTLNLGLRYDIDLPRTERYDRMNWFDPDARSPLADVVPGFPDLRGGVRFVGVDRNPRTHYNIDGDNFAPRVGFAYQATEKTVVRAGYGHFYGPSNQAAQGTVGPFGFRTENLWVTSLDNGLTPFNTLRNPYPQGFRPVPGASEGLLTQAGANLQGVLQDTLAPMSMQWNLTVQRELPLNSLIEVGYVGNRGLHLFRSTESGLNLNQLDPRYMELGSRLNDRVPNPFSGIVDNGVLVGSTVSRAQLLRAYPQFTDIIPLYSSGASSNYHSLQITGRKRFSHGFQFEGSYTWAKIIDEGTQHQDSYNIRASRSLADHDIAHRFVMSYIYELPFGRGRRFGAGSSRVMDLLLGGW